MVTSTFRAMKSLKKMSNRMKQSVPSCSTLDPVAPWSVGSWIGGRYEIIATLGSGSSASAYEARDAFDASRVTIKVLRERATEQFFRSELTRLRDLYHPNLPRVRDVSVAEHPYFVTDFVEGQTLSRASNRELVRVLIETLRALAFIHDLGIRHGDVSADNIIVSASQVVLIDFGCADACGSVSHVSGTPGLIAPEVFEGDADGRADVFALGKTIERIAQERGEEPPAVVAMMTRESREQRPSATEVLTALGESVPLGPPKGHAGRLVGREEELAVVAERVSQCRQGNAQALVLRGAPGVGRTRLLQRCKWECGDVPWIEIRDESGPWGALEALLEQPIPDGYEGWCIAVEQLDRRAMPLVVLVDDLKTRSAERLLSVSSRWVLPIVVADLENASLELQPLDRRALSQWAPQLTNAEVDALFVATHGYPADVEAALAGVAAGEHTTMDLAVRGDTSLPDDPHLQQALATIAVGGRVQPRQALELQRLGWLVSREGLFELRRSGDRQRLREEMPSAMQNAHAQMLEASSTALERVWHLSGAGQIDDAVQLAQQAHFDDAPDKWAAVLDGWAPANLQARAQRLAGRPDKALSELESAQSDDFAWHLESALVHLGRGDGELAEKHARAASGRANTAQEHADAADALARALLRITRYADALQVATAALDTAPVGSRPALSERIGVARMYLGDLDGAHRALGAAERTHAPPRDRVRLCSYRAIAAFRAGDLTRAHASYREARQLAETHKLPDLLATTAMNEATVLQQLGDWGGALKGYQRALRLALALGRESTARALRFNLANLQLSIGRADASETHLDALPDDVADDVRVSALVVRAELARFRGDVTRARGFASEAKALAQRTQQQREAQEASLLELELGAPGNLDALETQIDADDLAVRVRVLRGQRALDQGRSREAFDELDRALAQARDVGERDQLARIATLCARAAHQAQAAELADRLRAEARTIWERIALTLDPGMREAFWAHPARVQTATTNAPQRDDRLERLLLLNRRINSTLATQRVLELAIDAAIELAGAERGFVLLADDEDLLHVAVARNLDHERIGRSKLKFSHSIAERVLRSGHPIVTRDARSDERFAEQRSVHAMRLTSVVCVPIESPRGQLGALYLDHRFTPGCFDDEDVHVLQALGDQVAIALDNAALTEALERRTRELEEEKSKVETLLAEREAQLEVGRAEIERLRANAPAGRDYRPLVGQSEPMRRVFGLLDRVVDSNLSVLILGESGTGKELVARALHRLGPEAHRPMLSVNCAAVPENLLESELFGHVRGAFTGADRDRTGLFAEARGGIVFLDEVGEMPLSMQAKLLRVLQEREVRPVGGTRAMPVDFRVLAATNRDLRRRVEEGAFRQDLYYRLAVVEVELPALRERRSDLPILIEALLDKLAREQGRELPRIDREAMLALQRHDWPGNVRELENVLSRALVLGSEVIGVDDLGLAPVRRRTPRTRESFEESESEKIAAMLELVGWNVSEAARRLNMPRNTLYRRMKRYGLHR